MTTTEVMFREVDKQAEEIIGREITEEIESGKAANNYNWTIDLETIHKEIRYCKQKAEIQFSRQYPGSKIKYAGALLHGHGSYLTCKLLYDVAGQRVTYTFGI